MENHYTPEQLSIHFQDAIIANKELWHILKNKDVKGFDKVFMPEGLLLDFSGWWPKDSFLQAMPALDILDYKLNDVKLIEITKKSVLITYEAYTNGSIYGHVLAPYIYRSSVWVRHNRTWKTMFHQATTKIQMDRLAIKEYLASFSSHPQ